MAGIFYPKTDGGEGCDNFNKAMATRLRRALGIVLEATARNSRGLSDREADALQEKIYTTLYPGGKLDISSVSEEEEDHDEEGAHIVDVSSRWNGKKMETWYTVDYGRGNVREFTKYGLKQAFSDEWKDMVHRYKMASEKSMPTRMQLKGSGGRHAGGRVPVTGVAGARRPTGAGGTGMGGIDGIDGIQRIDDMEQMDHMDAVGEIAEMEDGPGSEETFGEEYYRNQDKPQQGSTMVDSTDGRKNFDGTRQMAHNRREGHGEGGLFQDAKHRDAKIKHRMSEPVPRVHGLGGHRDLQLERLPQSGPVQKRQRLSLSTPRTGRGILERTPLTGDGDRAFVTTRTDTASIAMEFMSRVLQNEELLKAELEDLAAQNKYLQGLLEDEELALNIAGDELADVKRERQERQQLEEVLRAREQELRSVKTNLRKLQSKNDNTLKDLTNEKEEWKAIATQAQDQLDRQLEQHAMEIKAMEQKIEEKAMLASKDQLERAKQAIQRKEQEFSKQRDQWGKEAALKLNEIEILRTSKAELSSQLKTANAKIMSLESDVLLARRETQNLKAEYTSLSQRMQEDVMKIRADARMQSERAAMILLHADQQLTKSMNMHDAWLNVPGGIQNVKHLLEFEDVTGEQTKNMDADAKELFMRLRPSQWMHCKIAGSRHNKLNSYTFRIKYTKPNAPSDAPGSTVVFDVDVEELKKRDYCQRALSEYYLSRIKQPNSKSKAKEDAQEKTAKSQGKDQTTEPRPHTKPAEATTPHPTSEKQLV